MAAEFKQTREKFITLTKFIHKKGGVNVLNALPNDPNLQSIEGSITPRDHKTGSTVSSNFNVSPLSRKSFRAPSRADKENISFDTKDVKRKVSDYQ